MHQYLHLYAHLPQVEEEEDNLPQVAEEKAKEEDNLPQVVEEEAEEEDNPPQAVEEEDKQILQRHLVSDSAETPQKYSQEIEKKQTTSSLNSNTTT